MEVAVGGGFETELKRSVVAISCLAPPLAPWLLLPRALLSRVPCSLASPAPPHALQRVPVCASSLNRSHRVPLHCPSLVRPTALQTSVKNAKLQNDATVRMDGDLTVVSQWGDQDDIPTVVVLRAGSDTPVFSAVVGTPPGSGRKGRCCGGSGDRL